MQEKLENCYLLMKKYLLLDMDFFGIWTPKGVQLEKFSSSPLALHLFGIYRYNFFAISTFASVEKRLV